MNAATPGRIIAGSIAVLVLGVLIWLRAETMRHEDNHQHIVAVSKVAAKAEHLAQRDAALIGAICREIHARDVVEAYYDNAVAKVAHEYASRTNVYVQHVRPLFEARNSAISKIARSDCAALVTKAMDARIPVVMPTVVGTPF